MHADVPVLKDAIYSLEKEITVFASEHYCEEYEQYRKSCIVDGKLARPAPVASAKSTSARFIFYKNLPHRLFVNLMRHAEYPVQVTGDQSVTEAIGENVPFVYEIGMKTALFYNLYLIAVRHDFRLVAEFLLLQKEFFNPFRGRELQQDVVEDPAEYQRFWEPAADTAAKRSRFIELFASPALRREFYLFDRKITEMDFEFWPMISAINKKLAELRKAQA
jgi:hypothetical protein